MSGPDGVVLHLDAVATAVRIRLARTWWRRAVGLLATRDLTDPAGLWIEPCNAVHMVGMRYALDIVFLDAQGRVMRVVHGLRPWRMALCPGARSTLELRAGLARSLGVEAGRHLTLG